MIAQLWQYTKSHWIVHFQQVNSAVFELHLYKPLFLNGIFKIQGGSPPTPHYSHQERERGCFHSLSCCSCLIVNVWWTRNRPEIPLWTSSWGVVNPAWIYLSTSSNQNKPIQNVWNKAFKKLDIKLWRTVTTWERGNKWGESSNCLDLLSTKFSGMAQGEETQAESSRLP